MSTALMARKQKRDNRADLWDSKRVSWISIYTIYRESPHGHESWAYLCVHESEKAGQDTGRHGKKKPNASKYFYLYKKNA